MSGVITFARQFPVYHPRKGEPTFFPEKVVEGLIRLGSYDITDNQLSFVTQSEESLRRDFVWPKWHTIRAGNRWKAGDTFSPRVWSGKPYNSPQIIIAPDIEIVKTWEIEIGPSEGQYPSIWLNKDELIYQEDSARNAYFIRVIDQIAKNDGLSRKDLLDWFRFPKPSGPMQVICWNPDINY